MPGRLQDVRARAIRSCVQEREYVLELVTEAEGSTRLVEGGAPEQARREGLVEQPPVEQEVHGRLRRLDLDATEQAVPERSELLPCRGNDVCLPESLDQRRRLLPARGLSEHEVRDDLLARSQLEMNLDGGARVHPRRESTCETPALEGLGACHVQATTEKLGAVGREPMERELEARKAARPANSAFHEHVASRQAFGSSSSLWT